MSYRKDVVFFTLILGIGLLWRVSFFWVACHNIHLSGDEAIRSLQALSISQPSESLQVQLQQHPPGIMDKYPLLFLAQPYLFPVESYLSAPFVEWLPRNEFGARLIPAMMGTVTFLFSLLLVRRLLSADITLQNSKLCEPAGQTVWPYLLVVFPSTFVLMLQVAYPLPSYQALMMFGVLGLWLADKHRTTACLNPLPAFLAALFVGIAASNSLLAAPLVLGIMLMVCIGRSWKKTITGTLSSILGLAMGLAPYFIAKQLYPGAHAAVSGTVDLSTAFSRIWEPAITYTLAVAHGMITPILPGWKTYLGVVPEHYLYVFGYFWTFLIGVALVYAIVRFFRRMIKTKWPEPDAPEILILICLSYIVLFVFSTRFSSHEFRYLMPIAFLFPFVIASIASIRSIAFRGFLICVIVIVTVVNIGTSIQLLRYWQSEEFDGGFVDTRPAIGWLRNEGIPYCYSSYMDVYTINFFADDKIMCSQPYNQRFPGWHLPYLQEVDRADKVAFVLGTSKRFSRERLNHELQQAGVVYESASVGETLIYYDFKAPHLTKAETIPHSEIDVDASHRPQEAYTLTDGVLEHTWRSHQAQKSGMWIVLRLPKKAHMARLKFYYNRYPYDHAQSVNIYKKTSEDRWQRVKSNVPWRLEPFDFLNGHPVYSNQVQLIELEGVYTDAIKIEIAEPQEGRDWTIGELELFVQ